MLVPLRWHVEKNTSQKTNDRINFNHYLEDKFSAEICAKWQRNLKL